MSAKDIFHDVVKKALVKQGWIITNYPLRRLRQNKIPKKT